MMKLEITSVSQHSQLASESEPLRGGVCMVDFLRCLTSSRCVLGRFVVKHLSAMPFRRGFCVLPLRLPPVAAIPSGACWPDTLITSQEHQVALPPRWVAFSASVAIVPTSQRLLQIPGCDSGARSLQGRACQLACQLASLQ